MAEVKQVDREACANALQSARPIMADEIRAGRMDNYAGVQAFAAHREAAEKAEREACAAFLRRQPVIWEADANDQLATAIRARGDGGAAMDELIARDADLI